MIATKMRRREARETASAKERCFRGIFEAYLLKRACRLVRVRLCAYTRERKATKHNRQKTTIDKNGFLSVISDKKYPSCIRLKIFNEKAK